MRKVKQGLLAGLIFATLDVLIMIPLEMEGKIVAMVGAFASRFAIGFLIPNTKLPVSSWFKGVVVGFLVSLPDAIITSAYVPVIGIGIIGGALIGWLTSKKSS